MGGLKGLLRGGRGWEIDGCPPHPCPLPASGARETIRLPSRHHHAKYFAASATHPHTSDRARASLANPTTLAHAMGLPSKLQYHPAVERRSCKRWPDHRPAQTHRPYPIPNSRARCQGSPLTTRLGGADNRVRRDVPRQGQPHGCNPARQCHQAWGNHSSKRSNIHAGRWPPAPHRAPCVHRVAKATLTQFS